MKKALASIFVAVVLILSVPLSVGAADYLHYFSVTSPYYRSNVGVFVETKFSTTNFTPPSSPVTSIVGIVAPVNATGVRFSLVPQGYVRFPAGQYVYGSFALTVRGGEYSVGVLKDLYVSVTWTYNGQVFELPVVFSVRDLDIAEYEIDGKFGFQIDSTFPDNSGLGYFVFESNLPTTTTPGFDPNYYLSFSSIDVTSEPSLEQQRHEELMQALTELPQDVRDKNKEFNDKLEELDDMTGQMEGGEVEAPDLGFISDHVGAIGNVASYLISPILDSRVLNWHVPILNMPIYQLLLLLCLAAFFVWAVHKYIVGK